MTRFDPYGIVMGLIPGGVGGVFNVVTGYPFDTIKVRMQMASMGSNSSKLVMAQTLSVGDHIRSTLATSGFRGFYQGVTAPLFAVTPYFACAFLTYDSVTSIMRTYNKDGSDSLSLTQCFVAGASTALPCSLFVAPSERVKCILQVQNTRPSGMTYNGSFDCARHLVRTGGLGSLYRGFGVTILRDAPGNGAYFGTYELLRNIFAKTLGVENRDELPTACILISGGFAGVANWIVAIPSDVVKSRYQTAADGMYSGPMQVFKEILNKEGVQALYRGLTPSLLRAFPANAAAFFGVELAHHALGNREKR